MSHSTSTHQSAKSRQLLSAAKPFTRGSLRQIYSNLARLLSGKAVAGLISLIYMVIAARSLGPMEYGVLILLHGYVMTIGGVLEFSGWHAVVRFGARALADGDPPRLTRLLAFLSFVELGFGVVAVLVAAVLAPMLGPRLGWSSQAVAFAPVYSLAVLASIRGTPTGYLQIIGRFDLIGFQLLIAPAVRIVGATIVALTAGGLKGFMIAWLIAALTEWIVIWGLGWQVARTRIEVDHISAGFRTVKVENPGLWRFMWAANADTTLADLSGRISPLIIGWTLGPAAAGLFAVAQRGTAILAQPASIFGQAAYAELAHLSAAGEQGDRLRSTVLRAIGILLLAAIPLGVGIATFGRQLAILMGGAAFAAAGGLVAWLAASRCIMLASPPLSAALTALGRPSLSVWVNLVNGAALLLALPPLLTHFGLPGAGILAILQAVAGALLLTFFLWRETSRGEKSGANPQLRC